jgi:peptidoglycan hydrolase-like protein with peptidoglycan-binding domain
MINIGFDTMPLMQFKEFIWPNNPSTCSLQCDRIVGKHRFPDISGAVLEDLNPDCAVLSGKGEFFGPNAYTDWFNLYTTYLSGGAGILIHPIFGTMKAIFKSLTTDMEPLPNYVSYSFLFWQHTDIQDIVLTPPDELIGLVSGRYGVMRHGDKHDWVAKLQTELNKDPSVSPKLVVDGSFGPKTEAAVRQYQFAHGLPVTGIVDEDDLIMLGLPFYVTTIVTKYKSNVKPHPNGGNIDYDWYYVINKYTSASGLVSTLYTSVENAVNCNRIAAVKYWPYYYIFTMDNGKYAGVREKIKTIGSKLRFRGPDFWFGPYKANPGDFVPASVLDGSGFVDSYNERTGNTT